eukprot:6827441-Alexandrium_andersonii.AAC.1
MVMVLLRYFDNRTYDPAGITSAISAFLRKIHWAFVDGRIVGMETSHTAVMLELLRRPVSMVVKGQVLTIGSAAGVPEDTLTQALNRLRSWVVLAAQTVRSEFPAYEPLQNFSIFALHERESIAVIREK